jgi:hypothetical protein
MPRSGHSCAAIFQPVSAARSHQVLIEFYTHLRHFAFSPEQAPRVFHGILATCEINKHTRGHRHRYGHAVVEPCFFHTDGDYFSGDESRVHADHRDIFSREFRRNRIA